jgi:hypothetical protein
MNAFTSVNELSIWETLLHEAVLPLFFCWSNNYFTFAACNRLATHNSVSNDLLHTVFPADLTHCHVDVECIQCNSVSRGALLLRFGIHITFAFAHNSVCLTASS